MEDGRPSPAKPWERVNGTLPPASALEQVAANLGSPQQPMSNTRILGTQTPALGAPPSTPFQAFSTPMHPMTVTQQTPHQLHGSVYQQADGSFHTVALPFTPAMASQQSQFQQPPQPTQPFAIGQPSAQHAGLPQPWTPMQQQPQQATGAYPYGNINAPQPYSQSASGYGYSGGLGPSSGGLPWHVQPTQASSFYSPPYPGVGGMAMQTAYGQPPLPQQAGGVGVYGPGLAGMGAAATAAAGLGLNYLSSHLMAAPSSLGTPGAGPMADLLAAHPHLAWLHHLQWSVGSIGLLMELLGMNAMGIQQVFVSGTGLLERLGHLSGEVIGWLRADPPLDPQTRLPLMDRTQYLQLRKQRMVRWGLGAATLSAGVYAARLLFRLMRGSAGGPSQAKASSATSASPAPSTVAGTAIKVTLAMLSLLIGYLSGQAAAVKRLADQHQQQQRDGRHAALTLTGLVATGQGDAPRGAGAGNGNGGFDTGSVMSGMETERGGHPHHDDHHHQRQQQHRPHQHQQHQHDASPEMAAVRAAWASR